MAPRSTPGDPFGDERLIRQLPALLREHRPELMVGDRLYRSPAGFTSWSAHWAKAVAVELALERSEQIHDHVGIWGGDGVPLGQGDRRRAPLSLPSPCPSLPADRKVHPHA